MRVHDRVIVQNNPVNFIDPLGLAPKDKFFGFPKKFWNWAHRNEMFAGDADIPDYQTAKELWEEWKKLGKPGPDSKGMCRRLGKKMEMLGVAITLYELYNAITATDAEAEENLMNLLEVIPPDQRDKILQDIRQKNPGKLRHGATDSW